VEKRQIPKKGRCKKVLSDVQADDGVGCGEQMRLCMLYPRIVACPAIREFIFQRKDFQKRVVELGEWLCEQVEK